MFAGVLCRRSQQGRGQYWRDGVAMIERD